MSKGDFGYGSTVREYRDSPSPTHGSSGFGGGYQSAGSGGGSFHQLVDEIRSNVFTVNNNATTIERTTRQIGSSTDSIQLRDKIHSTEQSTNGIISSTKVALKQLGSLCSKNNNRNEKVQYERLHCEFKASCEKYVKLQRDAADKVRSTPALKQGQQQKSRSDLINWGETVDDEDRLLEQDRRREQMQAQQDAVEEDVAMLQEREDRIRQLESDILDINEIFRDLGTFVHEQGEVIDTIEANVENAYDHVEAGQQELIKASRYQRKARKKKCILVIILLIVLLIIGLVIYLSVR